MNTKQLLFVSSLAAVAVLGTSCSKDEVVKTSDAQAISFRVQGSLPATRTTGTTPNYVNAFVVYGIDNVSSALIFDGVTVARQKDGSFDYNPKKYFSENAVNSSFVAYSPVSTFISSPVTTNLLISGATFNYEVVSPDGSDKTTQEDLLVAVINQSVSATSPQTIPLNFRHALARIFVKASNSLSEDVTVTGLKLLNLNSKGTLDAGTLGWSVQNTSANYTYTLAPTGVAVKKGLSTATLVTSNEQGMMVIPQTLAWASSAAADYNSDFALEVSYSVANLTGKKAYVYLADGYEFEAGKQYAITVNFSGTSSNLIEIKFTVSVTDFQTITDATLAP